MSCTIDYCGEGPVDAAIARRLIQAAGAKDGIDYVTLRGPRGKDALDRRIPGLIIAAKHGRRVLVLRDLDAEMCAGLVVRRLAQSPPIGFCLRVAVRAVEAWLLADHDGIRRGLRLGRVSLPPLPESLTSPKDTFRNLAQTSLDTTIRAASTSTPQAFGAVTSSLVTETWDPTRAASRAPSLARALIRLRALCL